MSEFGRVCERRKLRVSVGNSKVKMCSRYGNGGRMRVDEEVRRRAGIVSLV